MKRRNEKRILCTIMTAMAAAGLLAGCGGPGSNSAASSAKAESTAASSGKEESAETSSMKGKTTAASSKQEETTAAFSKQEETMAASSKWEETAEEAEVIVFAAKSLNQVLDELIALYQEGHPHVIFVTNYDSSSTLMTQIDEGGASCDVFFSAAQSQMDTLEEEGLVVDGTRKNVVNNQVCVVTYAGSPTKVTGLMDMDKAASLALADGSVPVGKYTRQAMVNAGILPETENAAAVTAREISDALGGVPINECANVGAVASAVAEQANEVGIVYYSDTFGYEGQLKILEVVPCELTGSVIYPVGRIVNAEATDAESRAAANFIDFLTSDTAKEVFEAFHFNTNV